MKPSMTLLIAVMVTVCVAGCGGDKSPAAVDLTPVPEMTLTSDAFSPGGVIPDQYTCNGAGVSPPLSWTGAPAETRALVLLVTDPDAPSKIFDHWVVYDIAPDVPGLEEAASGSSQMQAEAKEGRNDFGDVGYGGPCPPKGSDHGYVFRIYALGEPLGLAEGATKEDVQKSMVGKVLASGELIGRFAR